LRPFFVFFLKYKKTNHKMSFYIGKDGVLRAVAEQKTELFRKFFCVQPPPTLKRIKIAKFKAPKGPKTMTTSKSCKWAANSKFKPSKNPRA